MNQKQKAEAFFALHRKGDPVILYNVWDAGTAKAVAAAGARALATGSWSVAAAGGYPDGEAVPLPVLTEIARSIVAATELPVSIDFEGAYAVDPDDVALNVARIVDTGAIGINFEDQVVGGSGLHPVELQGRRIRAIRQMAEKRDMPFFINARTDLFLQEADGARHGGLVEAAIERGLAFAEAGADGFFVPWLADPDLIGRICEAVPLPVNVMMKPEAPDAKTLAGLGVARISYGPRPYLAMIDWLGKQAAAVYGTA
ncbi:2-methylisocitrate lyase-like PEP mutase family enzyme [Rhizobium azooxidifex]|uniref:2-methylisocitrate lyase-like PEP mutase family enzyme n=1 Tax=Mycoplana azooxidifex TaxID=1636188 RepID=A0A7W6D980_9HYPH|nr:isocitrate lyase/phosphoenolpyruvate mutase family protein [Mycoplana azooxidifex]MBB3976407.1 2-methylisocitrate lyase-like PEP mutase family enzyme [Mycoplana azooxidifex]